jgi:hypothetical protein
MISPCMMSAFGMLTWLEFSRRNKFPQANKGRSVMADARRKSKTAAPSGVRRLDVVVNEEDLVLFRKAASMAKPPLSLVGWARTVLKQAALAAQESR